MNPLEEQKRQLLARSEWYRQDLAHEVERLESSLAWVPKAVHVLRSASPVLMVAAPFLGRWFWKRRHARSNGQVAGTPRRGWLARAWRGFQLFQQVRPFLDGFVRARQSYRRTGFGVKTP